MLFSGSLVPNSFATPWAIACQLLCPGDFPGKNTGVGCHFLLQGIFPTQGWNSCLLHWQVDSLPLVPPGKPLFRGRGVYISCSFMEAIGRNHLNAWTRAMDLKYLTLILTDIPQVSPITHGNVLCCSSFHPFYKY